MFAEDVDGGERDDGAADGGGASDGGGGGVDGFDAAPAGAGAARARKPKPKPRPRGPAVEVSWRDFHDVLPQNGYVIKRRTASNPPPARSPAKRAGASGGAARVQPAPLASPDVDEDYEVTRVVDKRTTRAGAVEYLVEWKGYEQPDEHTWEPAAELTHAAALVKAFERSNGKKSKAAKAPARGRGVKRAKPAPKKKAKAAAVSGAGGRPRRARKQAQPESAESGSGSESDE